MSAERHMMREAGGREGDCGSYVSAETKKKKKSFWNRFYFCSLCLDDDDEY